MFLYRKIFNISNINTFFYRQRDSINFHFNQSFSRYFSSYHFNKTTIFQKSSFSLNNTKKNSLFHTNQFFNQRYIFMSRVQLESGVDSVEVQDSYAYPPSKYRKTDSQSSGLDLNDPKYKWVKESMEVEHESYEKLMTTYLPHVKSVVTFYRHKENGLTVVSFKTNDSKKEMSFDVSAPTYQFNDHGCTHVLEHSVLMRTAAYNTFNAFYYNVAGTYHSFLNALFYKNRTRFYFSSLSDKSYYQLAHAFMDSFFRPSFLQDEEVLKQEGWHYKVVKDDDKNLNSKEVGVSVHGRHVTYSGVVYNEMKKRMFATPLDYGLSVMDHNLYTNSFKYDSGGNPDELTNLTQKELSDFYKLYYGPKTATVFFHGPGDVKKRLSFVDDYVRKNNVGLKPDSKTGSYSHTASQEYLDKLSVKEEYRDTPKYVKSQFNAVNPNEDLLLMGWVLNPSYKDTNKYQLDTVDKLAFEVLNYLLFDNHQAVVHRKLLDSKLGSRVVVPGYEDFYPLYPHMTLVFGVDGVKFTENSRYENVMKFEQVVFEALRDVVDNGFKKDAVEAALNKVEFKHKEQKYLMKEHRQGYYPKGLTLLRYVESQYQSTKDPVEFLRFEQTLSELRRRVSSNSYKYLSDLVKKHMLNNTTRVTLHLEAVESNKFEKELNKKTVEKLQSKVGNLSKEEVDKMEREYKEFKEKRERLQDPKSYDQFPDFEPSDAVSEKKTSSSRFYKLSEKGYSEVKSVSQTNDRTLRMFAHPADTNGVMYMDYALSLDNLSVEDLKYLGLLASMMKESGTDKLSSEELSYRVDKNLGGLVFSTYFTTVSNNVTYDDPTKGLGYLLVRSKSLKNNVDEMVEVVNDVLLNANFSNSKKGLELVKRRLNCLQSKLLDSAHETTLRRMASKFSVDRYADELVNGYSQLVFLKDTLLPLAEKDWSKVESKLNELRNKLLNKKYLTVNLTGDEELLDGFLNKSKSFYNKLNSTFRSNVESSEKLWVKEVLDKKLLESTDKNELLVMPVRNNFVGVGGKLFDSSDKVSGQHGVAMHYLMRSVLYRYLRSSGGSYGAHVYLLNTGHVVMFSYADPNFLETLETYKKVPKEMELAHSSLTNKALKMHVVGKLGTMDQELHPDDKALSLLKSNLRGETQESANRYRKEVVETTKKVFKEVADKFKSSNDWLNVVSLVNRVSAETAPSSYKRLY